MARTYYKPESKVAIGFKKAFYWASCLFWVPLSIAVSFAVLPIASFPRWIEITEKNGLKGFLLAPLHALIGTLVDPLFFYAIDYGKNIGSRYHRSFFDTFFGTAKDLLGVEANTNYYGLTAGQKFVRGLKKTLFALSCVLWIPLRIAIDVALLPFRIITGYPAAIKKNGAKGFLDFTIETILFPFYSMYNALEDAIYCGTKIGTKWSTARGFAVFVFRPVIDLVGTIKYLFTSSKSAETPKDDTRAPKQASENETDKTKSKEEEQGKGNKETDNIINGATNKTQETTGGKPGAMEPETNKSKAK